MNYALQIITAFLGSLGFSVLFNIRRTKLLIAGLGGMLSWSVYLLLGLYFDSDPIRYFFAAIFVTVYAEIFARIKKTPTTPLFVSAVYPPVSRRRALQHHEICFAQRLAELRRYGGLHHSTGACAFRRHYCCCLCYANGTCFISLYISQKAITAKKIKNPLVFSNEL